MTPMQRIAAAFAMTDAVWERHANPWSGYTRFVILPLAVLAIWARVWIGAWCLVPLGVLALWTWVNPRAFPPPVHSEAWITCAVLGERVWLNARSIPIPRHHARAATLLAWLPMAGVAPMAWGLVALDPWAAALGTLIVILAKLWFLDRMAWLWHDMRGHAGYRGWHRPRG